VRHNWLFISGGFRYHRHRCKGCGLLRDQRVPLEGFPVSTYVLKTGTIVKGKAPKCVVVPVAR
jgi:hypothetical protein